MAGASEWNEDLQRDLEQLHEDCAGTTNIPYKLLLGNDANNILHNQCYPHLTPYFMSENKQNRTQVHEKGRNLKKKFARLQAATKAVPVAKSTTQDSMPVATAVFPTQTPSLPTQNVLPQTVNHYNIHGGSGTILGGTYGPGTLLGGINGSGTVLGGFRGTNVQGRDHSTNIDKSTKIDCRTVHNDGVRPMASAEDGRQHPTPEEEKRQFEMAIENSLLKPQQGTLTPDQFECQLEQATAQSLADVTQKKKQQQMHKAAPHNDGSDSKPSACKQLSFPSPAATSARGGKVDNGVTPAQPNIGQGSFAFGTQNDDISAGESFFPGSPASVESSIAVSVQARVMRPKPQFLSEYEDDQTLWGLSGGFRLEESTVKRELLPQWQEKIDKGKKVKKVHLMGCPITPDGAQAMAPFLKAHARDTVEYVDFSGILSKLLLEPALEVIASLCDSLYGARNLRHVVWNRAALSQQGTRMVAAWFLQLTKLQSVYLDDSGIEGEGVVRICEALRGAKLKNFLLGNTPVTVDATEDDSALEAIGMLIEHQPNLATIAIPGLRAGITAAIFERTVMRGLLLQTFNRKQPTPSSCLVALDLTGLSLGCEEGPVTSAVHALSLCLAKAPQVRHLNAHDAGLYAHDVASIFWGIQSSGAKLEKVSLEYCDVGLEGAKSIGQYFATAEGSLEEVNLAGTFIEDEGVKYVLNGMEEGGTKTLDYLNLSECGLEDDGFRLVNDFAGRVNVAKICLEGNGLDTGGEVAVSIQQNCSQAVLDTPTAQGLDRQGDVPVHQRLLVSPKSGDFPMEYKTSTNVFSPPASIKAVRSANASVVMSNASPLSEGSAQEPTQPVVFSELSTELEAYGGSASGPSAYVPMSEGAAIMANKAATKSTSSTGELTATVPKPHKATLMATKVPMSESDANGPSMYKRDEATLMTDGSSMSGPSTSAPWFNETTPEEAALMASEGSVNGAKAVLIGGSGTSGLSFSAPGSEETKRENEARRLLGIGVSTILGNSSPPGEVELKVDEAMGHFEKLKTVITLGYGSQVQVTKLELLFSTLCNITLCNARGYSKEAIGAILTEVSGQKVSSDDLSARSSKKRTPAFFDLARKGDISNTQLLTVLPTMTATMWVCMGVEDRKEMFEKRVISKLIRPNAERILEALDVPGDWSSDDKTALEVRNAIWKAFEIEN
eukprot:scaffold513_cov169-Amphora_coffeaeformis.AAC.10